LEFNVADDRQQSNTTHTYQAAARSGAQTASDWSVSWMR
jgi:hypothetical protein